MKFMLFILATLLVSLVSAQCTATTCGDCSALSGCGWCAATLSCLAGNSSGPTDSFCQAKSWYTTSHPCPDCGSLDGCTECTDSDGCGWIVATSTCAETTNTDAKTYCPCDLYEQCTDCTRGGCTFCQNTGLCQDTATAGCTALQNCSCGSISDCAICVNQDDICGWCGDVNRCQSLTASCADTTTPGDSCEAQTCAGKTCGDCTADPTCGWCAATLTCLPGTSAGPTESSCQAKSWYTTNHPCPDCSKLDGCTACTDSDGCGWISASSTCAETTVTDANTYCPCDLYEQCTDCTRGGCTFCQNTGLCQDTATAGCTALQNCSCASIKDCAVCVEQDDICGWCSDSNGCQSLTENCASGEGDTCEPQTCAGKTCGDCTADPTCGWCAATLTCLPGDQTGPTDSTCQAKSWYTSIHTCPDCSRLNTCTECTDSDGCGWIPETLSCDETTNPDAKTYCPCSAYEQCTDCTRGGCIFCSNTGQCQDDASGGCVTLQNCSCGSISDCAICVEQDDICGWCSAIGGCQSLQVTCASGEGDSCPGTPQPEPASEFTDRDALIVGLSVGWFMFVVMALALVASLVYSARTVANA